jgi:uncharacterized protein DUF4157
MFNPQTNSIQHKGASIPLPADTQAGSRPVMDKQFAAKANEIKATAIRYNPKADPKYNARASMGAANFSQGNSVAFKPGAGMGQSLIGHELTHVVQQ